ncbi:restriction endonuclease subunit S [Micromonospora sp. WMMD737]|uniref:restriction endonuclease subunit S n=1 Tax=Micromonospora sp. WMMD737 TaxID=3404113 RepID=UPI003B944D08
MTPRVPFREIIDFARGGGWGSDQPLPGHSLVAIIRGTDFSNVQAKRLVGVPHRWEKDSKLPQRTLRPGDVILEISGGSSARGQSTGRTLFVDQSIIDSFDAPVIPASFCRVVRFSSSVVPRYAYYGLQDMYNSGRAAGYENQSTGISNFQFERFLDAETLRLPSRFYQSAVASLLGALDDKIAVNEKIAATVHRLARIQYLKATTSDVKMTTIGKIADIFDGPHATPKKTDSGPFFLSVSSLRGGRLMLEESAHLSEQDFERWTRRVTPQQGDVLFSYETRLGEAALMPPGIRACLGRRMALLRPREEEVGPRTLLNAFLSESFQGVIRQRAVHGATVDRIPLTELASWPIAVPAGDSQRLELALRELDDLATVKGRESGSIAALRNTLLPGLMSGAIRMRDAEKAVEDAT